MRLDFVPLILSWPMNELPVIRYLCFTCTKISGIAAGQTLPVVRRKSMSIGCFDVQKNHFGDRSTLFSCCFIKNGLRQCWYMGSQSFFLEKCEICYNIPTNYSKLSVRFIVKSSIAWWSQSITKLAIEG